MGNSEHEGKFTGRHPHNGECGYQCLKCGATDWIAHYGTMDQLKPEKCEPAVEEVPEPLACHVCGSTSEQHFNGCGIAEFCPETGRPIPRETDPPAPEKSVGGIPPGWQLVPKKATVRMIEGARHAEVEGYWAMWDAMLAAAPEAPCSQQIPKIEAEQIFDRIFADVRRLKELGWTSEIHGQFCLPGPKDWAKFYGETCVRQGRTIKSVIGSTGADNPEARRHENQIVAEMRRLGAKEE